MKTNVVTFHYTLTSPEGRLIDSSQGGDPVIYLEGSGHIIDGLEQQLRELPAGAKKKVQVPAARGYGLRDDTMVQKVKRQALPVAELKLGDQFQAGSDRHAPVVTVVALDDDDVTLDANHPLAGVDLLFDVEIIAVRAASEEELAHGHVHGAGGHHSHAGGESGGCGEGCGCH